MAENQTVYFAVTAAGVPDDRAIPTPPGMFRPIAAVACRLIGCTQAAVRSFTNAASTPLSSDSRSSSPLETTASPSQARKIRPFLHAPGGVAPVHAHAHISAHADAHAR
jgi:hypothetical protein